MFDSWLSPGSLLAITLALLFFSLPWASDRGLEPVSFFGYELDDDEKRRVYRRYVFARNVNRVVMAATALAALNLWWRW